ncbi:Transposon Ty3-G Gag-Pol poly [Paramuricea clavata]|uniref:Transposon Ty3-G Gag-Pol poly n=1 Tax=Paramuricea clavata TaxID=317549 RepID=A0A6S7I4H1_PARCT|nr:Transposon Ty3-G Gag-Pol poly [Paramuricea clavata]
MVNLRIFKNLSTSNYKPRQSGRRQEATQGFSRTKRSKLDGMRIRPRLLYKGIDCEQLKDKLRAIARTESDEDDGISLIDKNNLDIGIHNEVERSIIIEGEDFEGSQVIDLSTQPNQILICSELVEKIKDLELDFNVKISALTQEVSSIQNKRKAYANESLLHENRALKDENKSLLQKVANLSFIVSDLNTKLKESENEKQSLVTVLKLVNLDQSTHDQNSHGTWKTQCRSMNKDQHLSTRSQDSEVVTRNAFDVLSDTGGNETNIYDYDDDRSKVDDPSSIATSQRESQRSIADNEASNSRPANKSTKHKQKRHANGSSDQHNAKDGKKKLVFIAGDSIVQNAHGWEMSNTDRTVAVKSFSGSKVNDMQDYLKPLLRRNPHQIILHVGTNDIKSEKSPDQLVEGIVKLVSQVREKSAHIKVAISALTIRKDGHLIQTKEYQKQNVGKGPFEKKSNFVGFN